MCIKDVFKDVDINNVVFIKLFFIYILECFIVIENDII